MRGHAGSSLVRRGAAGASAAAADAELAVAIVAPSEHIARHGQRDHVSVPARHQRHMPPRHGGDGPRRRGAAAVAVTELAVLAGSPRVKLAAFCQCRGKGLAAADSARTAWLSRR